MSSTLLLSYFSRLNSGPDFFRKTLNRPSVVFTPDSNFHCVGCGAFLYWSHLWRLIFLLPSLCSTWIMVLADSRRSTMPGSQAICVMDSGTESLPRRSKTALSLWWMETRWMPRAQTQHRHQLIPTTLFLWAASQVSARCSSKHVLCSLCLWFSTCISVEPCPRMWTEGYLPPRLAISSHK